MINLIKLNAVTALFVALGWSLVGCTTNLENPMLNQTGRTGNVCTKSCDDANTSCVGKCTDDGCKAGCTTTHNNCTTSCGSSAAGSGSVMVQAGAGSTDNTSSTGSSTVNVSVMCMKSCEEGATTCSGKCNDDGCRGMCTTTRDSCVTHCQ